MNLPSVSHALMIFPILKITALNKPELKYRIFKIYCKLNSLSGIIHVILAKRTFMRLSKKYNLVTEFFLS